MNKIFFGKTDLEVSEMCLGTLMFGDRCDEVEADKIISAAFEYGVNFIDTASMNCDGRTEEILGRSFQKKRHQFIIASKVHKGLDRQSLTQSIEESLQRLRTDYLDIYLIQWPKNGMQVDEIMETLNDIVEQGKARYIGCCNYPAYLFMQSNMVSALKSMHEFACLQIPYNLIERGVEIEVLPMGMSQNIGVMAYRPLAMGLLTGKYHSEKDLSNDCRGQSDERISRWLTTYGGSMIKFEEFADTHNSTMSELALAWIRSSPAVTCPVVGVSSLSQFQSCLCAFEFDLALEERDQITKLFNTEVKEEAGGAYKGLRRNLNLISKST